MTKFEAGKVYSVWSISDLAEIRVRIAERAGNIIITDDFRKLKISVVDGIERVTLWHVPFAPTMTAA